MAARELARTLKPIFLKNYRLLRVDALQILCEAEGQSSTGPRDQLVARLRAKYRLLPEEEAELSENVRKRLRRTLAFTYDTEPCAPPHRPPEPQAANRPAHLCTDWMHRPVMWCTTPDRGVTPSSWRPSTSQQTYQVTMISSFAGTASKQLAVTSG